MPFIEPINKSDFEDEKPYGYQLALYPLYDAHFKHYSPHYIVAVRSDNAVIHTYTVVDAQKGTVFPRYTVREHQTQTRYSAKYPDGIGAQGHFKRTIPNWKLYQILWSHMENGWTIYYK